MTAINVDALIPFGLSAAVRYPRYPHPRGDGARSKLSRRLHRFRICGASAYKSGICERKLGRNERKKEKWFLRKEIAFCCVQIPLMRLTLFRCTWWSKNILFSVMGHARNDSQLEPRCYFLCHVCTITTNKKLCIILHCICYCFKSFSVMVDN